jgi:hypothetical protein
MNKYTINENIDKNNRLRLFHNTIQAICIVEKEKNTTTKYYNLYLLSKFKDFIAEDDFTIVYQNYVFENNEISTIRSIFEDFEDTKLFDRIENLFTCNIL